MNQQQQVSTAPVTPIRTAPLQQSNNFNQNINISNWDKKGKKNKNKPRLT